MFCSSDFYVPVPQYSVIDVICVPSGLIQMVPDSTTLAKIQNAGGIFGPLKDTSMKKWFGNNTTVLTTLCSYELILVDL